MKNKLLDNEKLIYIFYCFSLIILTIPRSIETVFPIGYSIINLIKLITLGCIFFLSLMKKNKFSSFLKILLFYCIYLFFVTIINNRNPITFLKVYSLNVGMIVLCELIFKHKERDNILNFISNYFLALLILNFLFIIVGFVLGNPGGKIFNTYFLGLDNRFILYILPTLLIFYYYNWLNNDKKLRKKMYFTYFLGFVTLFSLWSLTSYIVLLIIGICYILISKIKKINLSVYFITMFLITFCILLVFFDISKYFEFIIVNILNKSATLSYRTIMWDRIIKMILGSKINLIFGFGFFDTSYIFSDILPGLNHIHNIILDPLFSGGIFGSLMFFNIYRLILKKIRKIEHIKIGKNLIIFISSIFILLIFDTYERYQIYYMLLFLIYSFSKLIFEKNLAMNTSSNYKIKNNPSVGILMATYNGEKYIKEQIESIINQSYKNWVLYISDDNSNDNTMKIIEKYKKEYNDKIVIIDNKNKLMRSAKMNFANLMKKVNGFDYYVFCDQDDVWDKNKILNLLNIIIKEEEKQSIPLLVYSDLKIVDNKLNIISESLIEFENKYLPSKNVMQHLLIENYFPGCAVMFNKKLKNKTKEIYKDSEMHDWWITLVAALTGKIIYINKPLVLYRQHENNTIGAKKDRNKYEKFLKLIKKIFNFKKTYNVWKEYQNTVLNQAVELEKRYKTEENIYIVKNFIKIMKKKSRIIKLVLLLKNGYITKEPIRILRLVL